MPDSSKQPKKQFIGGGQPAGPSDVNEGVLDKTYDKAMYYVRSVDKHHNRDSARCESTKVPPFLLARAAKWVNDDRTPYRSIADIFRDGLAHRLHQLDEWDQNPMHDWGSLTAAEKRAQIAREREDMQKQVECFSEDFTKAIQHRDFDWVQELVKLGQQALTEFKEPYRSRLKTILDPYINGQVQIMQTSQPQPQTQTP